MDHTSLRGIVFSKYRNISAFAKAMNWGRNKAYRIVNGLQDPDIDEMCAMATVLGIDDAKLFLSIFFAKQSTMWTT